MRRHKLLFFALLTIGFGCPAGAQNISPSLIQKARAAGVSQAQIDAAINAQSALGTQKTSGQKVEAQEEEGTLITDRQSETNSVELISEIPIPVATKSRIFGKDIFSNRLLNFTPSFKQATPRNYVLGAGDELLIEVWGSAEMYTKAKVSPEGTVNIRSVGPIMVMGLTIDDAEKKIKNKVATVMSSIGTSSNLKISLSGVRSIKVNVVGEIQNPGTYTISSFASVFNALYAAGGVNEIGSLRNIQVYRQNQLVATLDVYDFLLQGKSESNIRLQDEDVIIVPAYECYVAIAGKVKREKIFELKKSETFDKIIQFAGGFTGEAYTRQIEVVRSQGKKQVLRLDEQECAKVSVADGDSVFVGAVTNYYVNKLAISGAVWRPGIYQLGDKTRSLSKLIEQAEGVRGNEFGNRGQIIRTKKDFSHEVLPFDVSAVLTGSKDIELQTYDSIVIPRREDMLEKYTVQIFGEVNAPNVYDFRDNMTVEDLIIASKGLTDAASLAKVEVSRRIKDPLSEKYSSIEAERFEFQIKEDLSMDPKMHAFILKPFDQVVVRRSPAYKEQKTVYVEGEVLYSGAYPILKSGERLSDLIKRTGGLTDKAYIQGTSLRRMMSKAQKLQLQSKLQLSAKTISKKDSIDPALLNLDTMYTVGIDMQKALKHPASNDDIVLKEGDMLFVPKFDNTVKISGAVLHANSVVFKGKSVKAYISQAGGYTDNASKRPFVVYMNGQVQGTRGWLFKRYPKVEPGAEIIVPVRLEDQNKMSTSEKLSLLLTAASTATVLLSLIRLF